MNKALRIFTLLITVVLINSCSTEGNGVPTIKHKWYLKEGLYEGVSTIYNSHSCSGTHIEFSGLDKYQVVYTVNCHGDVVANGTFIKEVNHIDVSGTSPSSGYEFSHSYEIMELTDHSLILHEDNAYYVTENGELVPDKVYKYTR